MRLHTLLAFALAPLLPVVPLVLIAPACVTTNTPSVGPVDDAGMAGSPCGVTSDCYAGNLCAYPIDAGCTATGICVPEQLSCTDDGPVVCGCDGTPVGLACIYGAGNAPVPVPSAKSGCNPDEAGLLGD
jgi:hypothetical protein